MPALSGEDALKLIKRRHHEWLEFHRHWRFLADSYEGGHRYKMADYSLPCDVQAGPIPVIGQSRGGTSVGGYDVATGLPNLLAYGRLSDRNLTPHLSETDPQNSDVYALRVARTPVPKKLEMVVRRHLGRIYAREVQRDGPPELMEWWADVDGCGTPIDKWMRKTVAPLLLTLGQIDLCFDHPEADDATPIETRADLKAAGLDKCVASYILPENMVWWELDRRKRYCECLVLERCGHGIEFRHWTAEDSTLYDHNAKAIETVPHPFGRVPIVRVFDDRKARCDNVGQSRYEVVADYQKAIYNAKSEQILADIQQADPLLQGPEDYCQGEEAVKVGPTSLLPMKKRSDGNGYDGFEYVEADQGQSQERRQHIIDDGDEINEYTGLSKPAGATGGGPVAQSGISKSFDDQTLNDLLAEVAATLEDAERMAAEYAMLVLGDGSIDAEVLAETLVITYPREFDLVSGDDLAANLTDMHGLAAGAGEMPETSKEYMKRKLRVDMPGLPDERREELEAEIEAICDRRQTLHEEVMEGMQTQAGMMAEGVEGGDSSPTPMSQTSN